MNEIEKQVAELRKENAAIKAELTNLKIQHDQDYTLFVAGTNKRLAQLEASPLYLELRERVSRLEKRAGL